MLTSPRIRPLRPSDFETLVLLEQQIDQEEGRHVCAAATSSTYYLRMCCDHLQHTSFLMEVKDEVVGYLLAFVQGREAFCGAFGVRKQMNGEQALNDLVQTLMAQVGTQVETLWWTVPKEAMLKRDLLQRLGGVEVEHRADIHAHESGRVLVRWSLGHEMAALAPYRDSLVPHPS